MKYNYKISLFLIEEKCFLSIALRKNKDNYHLIEIIERHFLKSVKFRHRSGNIHLFPLGFKILPVVCLNYHLFF